MLMQSAFFVGHVSVTHAMMEVELANRGTEGSWARTLESEHSHEQCRPWFVAIPLAQSTAKHGKAWQS